jgi:hypothetical protein
MLMLNIAFVAYALTAHGGGYSKLRKHHKGEKIGSAGVRDCCCAWADLRLENFKGGRIPTEFLPSVESRGQCKCQGGTEKMEAQTKEDADFAASLAVVLGKDGQCHEKVIPDVGIVEYGFGSMLHSLVKPILLARNRGISLNMAKLAVWSNPKTCPALDLSCFFQPVGDSCVPAAGEPTEDGDTFTRNTTAEWTGKIVKEGRPGTDSTGDGVDRFMDVARTLAFIMEPSDEMQTTMDEVQKDLGWNVGEYAVLGVHVRTGDACNNNIMTNGKAQNEVMGRSCQGLDKYMPFILKATKLYGIKHIYLATDGGAAIHNATKEFPEFTWFFSPRVKNKAHKFIEVRGHYW